MTAPDWFIGVDVGASGARARATSIDGSPLADAAGPGASATPTGAPDAVLSVLDALLARGDAMGPPRAVAIGSTGLGTLGASSEDLRARVVEMTGSRMVVVAIDAVAAHVGALDGRPGVTVAAGTGAITLAEDRDGGFHRIDGWGHLLGDRGSAAWIGMRGLGSALEAVDGTDPRAAGLLDRAIVRFGQPLSWPSAIYGRDDRASVLGSFARDVTSLAEAGDAAAAAITDGAARALAASARAALSLEGVPPVVALTGGVFASSLVRRRFMDELGGEVRIEEAHGTPLDGAVRLAASRAAGRDRPSMPGLLLW